MQFHSKRLPLVAALMLLGQPALVSAQAAAEKTLPTVKVEAEKEQSSKETLQATRTRIGKGEPVDSKVAA
ncbi:hypothetical protein MASR1M60_26090 [Rhodocyclaceae bacterium]